MNTVAYVRDEEFRKEWSRRHPFCQACGTSYSWPCLSVHHIIKFKRSDEACNFLKLCVRCHGLAEGFTIWEGREYERVDLAVWLAIKLQSDPEEFDLERARVLHGKYVPEPVAPPKWLDDEFVMNTGRTRGQGIVELIMTRPPARLSIWEECD